MAVLIQPDLVELIAPTFSLDAKRRKNFIDCERASKWWRCRLSVHIQRSTLFTCSAKELGFDVGNHAIATQGSTERIKCRWQRLWKIAFVGNDAIPTDLKLFENVPP
jgi:hypothetical protein